MTYKKNNQLMPVLKWVGGKRQLLPEIIPMIPNDFTYYVEPFMGGGAVLFGLQPQKAILNDYNSELMNVYRMIRDCPEELIELLRIHKQKNSTEYYYEIRGLDRRADYSLMSNLIKAARIIFLNKTCFNGLYRVNKAGYYNTSYGKYKNPNIVNEDLIRAISFYFNENNIQIFDGDYKDVLLDLDEKSFVYMDPPYMPISATSAFTSYTENGFDINKQKELKEVCDMLTGKDIRFLLSNSDSEFIHELYDNYNIRVVQAKRAINCKGDRRGKVNELLISNY